MEGLVVERVRPELVDAFLRLHSAANGAGWCRCVAWWTRTWDGWEERTEQENLELRCALFEAGEHDGLLAFAGEEPVGWCQAGPRDRFEKLVSQLELTPSPTTWAVTCFLVSPSHRRQGVAGTLLAAAAGFARAAGATRLEGYPRAGVELADDDAWTGTARLFEAAGFREVRTVGRRAVLALDLHST